MIIPPDPEKDPRLFDPSASTSSLVAPPSEVISHEDVELDYPFGDENAIVNWDTESLPPYSRQRRSRASVLTLEHEQVGDPGPQSQATRTATLPTVLTSTAARHIINYHPSSSTSLPTTSSHHDIPHLPAIGQDANSASVSPSSTVASTSKLWEGSSRDDRPKSRLCGCLPPLPIGFRKWWKRWRKWALSLIVAALVAIGVVIGVIVGRRSVISKQRAFANPPWHDKSPNNRNQQTTWNGDGSFNLTYVDSRDGPAAGEGNITSYMTLNNLNITSSPFSAIFSPFTVSKLSFASFQFPMNDSNLPDLFFIARGLGSSGTTTFVGSDGPAQILGSGEEGKVLVDVVVRYAGPQDLSTMMRVYQMAREDGSVGVGIYSPTHTDGEQTNIYNLNPVLIPTSHILIRLPPSAYNTKEPPLFAPSLSMNYDGMGARFGDLRNVVDFGTWNVTSARGGVDVAYAAMQNVVVHGGNGQIKGQWNVSQSVQVNVTDAVIRAGVILYDPSNPDNSSTLVTPDDYSFRRRSYSSSHDEPHSLPRRDIQAPSHPILTTFATTCGDIELSYLHHPPTVALSSVIASEQGNIDIIVNPNYVGPFAAKTVWGELFISEPSEIRTQDPIQEDRSREVQMGFIDTSSSNSIYPGVGISQDNLQNSTNTLSGVAYWANTNGRNAQGAIQLKSLAEVQTGSEGRGNQMVVLGAWGDVKLSFDGP